VKIAILNESDENDRFFTTCEPNMGQTFFYTFYHKKDTKMVFEENARS
jgi:hypothetical protein